MEILWSVLQLLAFYSQSGLIVKELVTIEVQFYSMFLTRTSEHSEKQLCLRWQSEPTFWCLTLEYIDLNSWQNSSLFLTPVFLNQDNVSVLWILGQHEQLAKFITLQLTFHFTAWIKEPQELLLSVNQKNWWSLPHLPQIGILPLVFQNLTVRLQRMLSLFGLKFLQEKRTSK